MSALGVGPCSTAWYERTAAALREKQRHPGRLLEIHRDLTAVYEKERTALLFIDPHDDFLSEESSDAIPALARGLIRQRNDLGVEAMIPDREAGNRHRQREASGSCTPRVDPENAVPGLNRRPVGVAAHHDGRPAADGRADECLAVVDHEKAPPADRERRSLRQACGPRAPIVVPAYGGPGRNPAQPRRPLRPPDAPRMHDPLDAAERCERFRAHQAVRVRDETDEAVTGAHEPRRSASGARSSRPRALHHGHGAW